MEDVKFLLQALGVGADFITVEAPVVISSSALTSAASVESRSRAQVARDDVAASITTRRAWQRVNTALYWHVQPSILCATPTACVTVHAFT